MRLIIEKCIAVFILSVFGISNISCNVPFSKNEAPKEELIAINVDSISDLALINELKANRFTRDTMFYGDLVQKDFFLIIQDIQIRIH